jgi:hypothetical protein
MRQRTCHRVHSCSPQHERDRLISIGELPVTLEAVNKAVLQSTAERKCNISWWWSAGLFCLIILEHSVVVWCGVMRGAVWCGVVWCGVVWCGVVWCGAVWHGAVCGAVQCGCAVRCMAQCRAWCRAQCGAWRSVVRGDGVWYDMVQVLRGVYVV